MKWGVMNYTKVAITFALLLFPGVTNAQIRFPANHVTMDSTWYVNDIRTWCGSRWCHGYVSKQCEAIQEHIRQFYPKAYCVVWPARGELGIELSQPYEGICICYR